MSRLKKNIPATPPEWKSFNQFLNTNSEFPIPTSLQTGQVSSGQYFHRDLSWLAFNDRVLSEAADPSVPALERLRFAGIVSSNLDEFFSVRVAELIRKSRLSRQTGLSSGFTPRRILAQVRDLVLSQKNRQANIIQDIFTQLNNEGIKIYSEFSRSSEIDSEIRNSLPELKFILRNSTEPPPPLSREKIHIFVRFPRQYAIITINDRGSRLLRLSPKGRKLRFALLERWLSAHAKVLFPQYEVIEAFPFKIIRDADLRYHPDDEETLEEQIIEAVRGRSRAKVVRLEVDAPHYSEGALFLATALGLDSAALYRFDLPLDLRTLATIYNIQGYHSLKYQPIKPLLPPIFKRSRSIFEVIHQQDILLHHPYDTFDVVVQFLLAASRDPKVTHIYHTMYRTSKESPIMEALKEGVKRGKKVTAYIEIKARFDELNNLRWAEELRQAGVKIIRPLGGYKVHCKLTQVLRTENNQSISYLHLGTGNYHPGTAKQYTDLSLMTIDPGLASETLHQFNAMVKRKKVSTPKELLMAPINLHSGFIKLIKEETMIQKMGGKGHIIAKMNSLVDSKVIDALYEASNTGVKIELIVRGICCLKPGVKGMSENIRVLSIVDRFLEHSRIYYFRAGGAKKIYLSS
ncbi:MAG: polyphosphate kinase 1, partial [Elusimicrobiota bacterium]